MKKAAKKARGIFQRSSKSLKGRDQESSLIGKIEKEECLEVTKKVPLEQDSGSSAIETTLVLPPELSTTTLTKLEHQSPVDKMEETETCSARSAEGATFSALTQPTRLSHSLSELSAAISIFESDYENFATKHSQFILIEHDFQDAFQSASMGIDIKDAARVFEQGVSATLGTIERKRKLHENKWITKVGEFLKKLYPVTRLSFDLAILATEVGSFPDVLTCEGFSFLPLKGAAVGLGVILQVL